MKEYKTPVLEIIDICDDIITASAVERCDPIKCVIDKCIDRCVDEKCMEDKCWK